MDSIINNGGVMMNKDSIFDSFMDMDGDGIPETIVQDTNKDGIADTYIMDSNGDGILDMKVLDSDQNGIIDSYFTDTNRDGYYDTYILDTNRDGYLETQIIDSNNDGIMDTEMVDTDGDGIIDTQILDMDGDENFETQILDTNKDGVFDTQLVDSDSDGIFDTELIDTNADGIIDAQGIDSNNDGIIDTYIMDRNQDGRADYYIVDADGDGKVESYMVDTNNDGIPDSYAQDRNNDGIPDEYAANASTMAGSPEEDMDNWHMQRHEDTCAVVSQEFILDELTGRNFTEEELMRVAMANGWYTPGGGTTFENVGKLLEAYGIEVERTSGNTMTDLESKLLNGDKIIVAVDSSEIWSDSPEELLDELLSEVLGIPDQQPDHAVQVIGIDKSDPNNPIVILNDPGHPDGMGMRVTAEEFFGAWEDSGFYMVSTVGN